MNRVVVKHTAGKPPFLGILFSSEQAALEEKNLMNYSNEELTLQANENYGRISISLYDSRNTRIAYHRLCEYDPKEYKAWRAYTHLIVNFGHCYKDGEDLKVARVMGKYFVLKILTYQTS